jgi:hypothetical protein
MTMVYLVVFNNGLVLHVDTEEFGPDGIGATLDRLAGKHGGIASINEVKPQLIAG